MADFQGRLYQLTWRTNLGYMYDKATLEMVRGWCGGARVKGWGCGRVVRGGSMAKW